MKILLSGVLLSVTALSYAAPLGDYQFKSPAFNGLGYSSHVLTVENQERTRQKEREDKIQAAIDKEASEKKNTNLAKFISNLESRIYAQISQNVATAMFANNSCNVSASSSCTGSINFQGSNISWRRVSNVDLCVGSTTGDCILLEIKAPGEITPTQIYVPLESFQMPGN